MNIIYATYTRRENGVCEFPDLATLTCGTSNDTLSKVHAICPVKTTTIQCTLTADNTVFTDSCVGYLKYLHVRYECLPAGLYSLSSLATVQFSLNLTE